MEGVNNSLERVSRARVTELTLQGGRRQAGPHGVADNCGHTDSDLRGAPAVQSLIPYADCHHMLGREQWVECLRLSVPMLTN